MILTFSKSKKIPLRKILFLQLSDSDTMRVRDSVIGFNRRMHRRPTGKEVQTIRYFCTHIKSGRIYTICLVGSCNKEMRGNRFRDMSTHLLQHHKDLITNTNPERDFESSTSTKREPPVEKMDKSGVSGDDEEMVTVDNDHQVIISSAMSKYQNDVCETSGQQISHKMKEYKKTKRITRNLTRQYLRTVNVTET